MPAKLLDSIAKLLEQPSAYSMDELREAAAWLNDLIAVEDKKEIAAQGRKKMKSVKYTAVKQGDFLIALGFDCMRPGPKRVLRDDDGGVYVRCEHGKHYLDGQIKRGGWLEGFKKK